MMFVGLNASAGKEKFVFPDDVVIVQAPSLPVDYSKWENKQQECRLPDGRVLEGSVFWRSFYLNDVSQQERVSIYSLNKKDFVNLHYTISGQWQQISGSLYLLADSQWGEFKIKDAMTHQRSGYLLSKIKSSYGIKDTDFNTCLKK
jgi:hypothetical protein